ncbi:MAG TPA: metal ABC transporter permease [Pseudonocardiaceae bacterium]|jgi:zinc/manganese transport system permease protein|nr:metal ABC transporter permease [Pseudonocardiaceae bacterium]
MWLADGTVTPSWNVVSDIRQLWTFPFMVNAFRAGTIIAVASAVLGWFMVLRRQTFAGHTLAVVGFPGAAGATLIGVSAAYGYFGFCVAAALVVAAIPRLGAGSHGHESAVTGTAQAFALACGFLFIALYKGFLNGVNALLFGTFLGITDQQVVVLLIVTAVVLAVLAIIGRPLLFTSIDPLVAQGRGMPVRLLSTVFLVLLGAAVAEASQITGTLLVFALLVMPAATAQVLIARPALSLAVSAVIAVLVTWLGLAAAYFSVYSIGFFVSALAFAAYLLAHLAQGVRQRWAIA